MKTLLAAVQFLTVFPVRLTTDSATLGRSVPYFPVVGLCIGMCVACMNWVLHRLGAPGLLTAVLSIATLAACSGGLHLDGLADTCDGFLSARPRERMLEIMRDSRIGTMGVLGLLFVLLGKITAMADMSEATQLKALVVAPIGGRVLMVAMLTWMPYARSEGGLADVFLSYRKGRQAVLGLLFFVALSSVLFQSRGLSIVAVTLLAGILVAVWSKQKIGGFTGDTLGAICEIGEAAFLAAASLFLSGGIHG